MCNALTDNDEVIYMNAKKFQLSPDFLYLMLLGLTKIFFQIWNKMIIPLQTLSERAYMYKESYKTEMVCQHLAACVNACINMIQNCCQLLEVCLLETLADNAIFNSSMDQT